MRNRVTPSPVQAARALPMVSRPWVTWWGRSMALVWTRLRRL